MLSYIGRRLAYSLPVLLVGSFVVFWGVRVSFDPTDSLRGSLDASRVIAERRHTLGLDKPLLSQYWKWLRGFVHGDWGTSSRTNGRVYPMVIHALGFTAQLVLWAVFVALIVSVLVGVYSAVHQRSPGDHALTALSYAGIAMPVFWLGLMANQFLSVWPQQHWHLDEPLVYFNGLHSQDRSGINLDYFRHLALPVLALVVPIVAVWSRLQRAAMLDVLSADYVRTARAKGLPHRLVLFKHALRNALVPMVSQTAVDIGGLFGGVIIIESIYQIPGMGQLFLSSLLDGDVYVVVAWMVVSAVFVIAFNLLADLVSAWLDPRIRLT
jgi:peptide/nickel transport system permease protein